MSEQSNPLNATKTSISWLQVHEKLIITFMVLLVVFFAVYKVLGIASSYESHKAQEAQAVVTAQAAKNDVALDMAKQLLASYQQQLTITIAANQTLTNAIATRNVQLNTQQKTDSQMAPDALAGRWSGLIGDTGVQTSASGYAVTSSAALATVQQIESVPVLTQDLTDEQSKNSNLQDSVDKANALISQGQIVVSGLNLQLTEADKACKVSIDAEKAKARKGKLRWFGIGYASGFISGILVHIFV